MTPAQLRAFSAVVRLGSVRAAAEELGVSDAGVSMHVAQLRKELDDPLFVRAAAGIAFTPGGLRLASRAVEILGLQKQTAIEGTLRGLVREGLQQYRWSMRTEPWSEDTMVLATVQVTFPAQGRDFDVSLSTLVGPATP